MANNNNNNNNKTGGSSNINKEIEIEKNLTTSSNMANSSSIIKINKTEYWLPEELWREVKDFMGIVKKGQVNWELIKEAKNRHLLGIGLPTFNITLPKRKVNINMTNQRNANTEIKCLIHDRQGKEFITPKEAYFRRTKAIYMERRLMTPKKWEQLASVIFQDKTSWNKVIEGTKFIKAKRCGRDVPMDAKLRVAHKKRNIIHVTVLVNRETSGAVLNINEVKAYTQAEFNKEFTYIIITNGISTGSHR